MLLDLLSTDQFGMYNVNVAKIVGLNQAIYLNELLNINKKAIQKNRVTEDGCFVIDRKYITNRTTFSEKAQTDIEDSLKSLSLLIGGKTHNTVKVNVPLLSELLSCQDDKEICKIQDIIYNNSTNPKAKMSYFLYSKIDPSNTELMEDYKNWIDSVIAKDGWMSVDAVSYGQRIVKDFSHGDTTLAKQLINIASINGYRNMTWAVSSWKRDHYENTQSCRQKVELAQEVF